MWEDCFPAFLVLMQLGLASFRGDEAGVLKAVDDGADVNAGVFNFLTGTIQGGTYCTAAYVAAFHGHGGVLGVLLSAPVSADPNKGGTRYEHTPCHAACLNDRPDAVTVLLAHGADPNRVSMNGYTSCMFAAINGHTACLRALAQGRTLDVNAVATGGSDGGKTALDMAVECKKVEAAAYLRDELGALRGPRAT